MRALIPEITRSNCSVHAWMLRQILQGAYGFKDELREDNWEELYDKAQQARSRPQRLKEICRLAGVSKILVHLPAKPMAEIGCDETIFVGLSDLLVPSMPGPKELAAFEKKTTLPRTPLRSFSTRRSYTSSEVRQTACAGRDWPSWMEWIFFEQATQWSERPSTGQRRKRPYRATIGPRWRAWRWMPQPPARRRPA
jgi:hypothetical protein